MAKQSPPPRGRRAFCIYNLGAASRDQGLEARVVAHQRQLGDPAVEAPHVAGVLDDQVDQHDRVDHVLVDDEVVLVLDERPIHVGHPVGHQQRDPAHRAHAHHQAGEQREADQEMTQATMKRTIGAIDGAVKSVKKLWKILVVFRKPTVLKSATKA